MAEIQHNFVMECWIFWPKRQARNARKRGTWWSGEPSHGLATCRRVSDSSPSNFPFFFFAFWCVSVGVLQIYLKRSSFTQKVVHECLQAALRGETLLCVCGDEEIENEWRFFMARVKSIFQTKSISQTHNWIAPKRPFRFASGGFQMVGRRYCKTN